MVTEGYSYEIHGNNLASLHTYIVYSLLLKNTASESPYLFIKFFTINNHLTNIIANMCHTSKCSFNDLVFSVPSI